MKDTLMLVKSNKTGECKFGRYPYDSHEMELTDPLDYVKALLDNDFKFTLTNKFSVYIGDLKIFDCLEDSKYWKNYRKKRTGSYSNECKWMGRRDLKDNIVLSGNVLCPEVKYEVYRFMYEVIGVFVDNYNKQNDLNMNLTSIYACLCGTHLLNLVNEKVDITKESLTKEFILQNGREFMCVAQDILKSDFSDALQQIYDREIKVKEKEVGM